MPEPSTGILQSLERFGLLLKQDKHLPSVVTLLTGEPLSTSWWSHPKSRLIFRVLSELADHPDVLFAKLLFSKDTLVHRALWPAFLAVATARERWQVTALSAAARGLLARSDKSPSHITATGAPVKELTSRLLVRVVEVHTDRGKHEMALASWSRWAEQAGVAPAVPLSRAREALEEASRRIGAPPAALPWLAGKAARGERAIRA